MPCFGRIIDVLYVKIISGQKGVGGKEYVYRDCAGLLAEASLI